MRIESFDFEVDLYIVKERKRKSPYFRIIVFFIDYKFIILHRILKILSILLN